MSRLFSVCVCYRALFPTRKPLGALRRKDTNANKFMQMDGDKDGQADPCPLPPPRSPSSTNMTQNSPSPSTVLGITA